MGPELMVKPVSKVVNMVSIVARYKKIFVRKTYVVPTGAEYPAPELCSLDVLPRLKQSILL